MTPAARRRLATLERERQTAAGIRDALPIDDPRGEDLEIRIREIRDLQLGELVSLELRGWRS